MTARVVLAWMGFASLATMACDLTETELAQPEEVLIVEAFLRLGDPDPQLFALLHNTLRVQPVPDADVQVTLEDGSVLRLAPAPAEDCSDIPGPAGDGTPFLAVNCYRALPAEVARISPGQRLELRVEVAGGGVIEGATTVPGDFQLLRPTPSTTSCAVFPDVLVEFEWTASENTWAYVAETAIAGLSQFSAEAEEPLELLGLAISSEDTTIVFPSEFGVFDRFDLDAELAAQLQKGLPPTTGAAVYIAATDRNYVNWVRGGNFNPSGAVRIPSLRGDGTGVFASYIQRFVFVNQTDPSPQTPACLLQ